MLLPFQGRDRHIPSVGQMYPITLLSVDRKTVSDAVVPGVRLVYVALIGCLHSVVLSKLTIRAHDCNRHLTSLYHLLMAEEMDATERQELIYAIASREGTAEELADRFNYTVTELETFTKKHLKAIKLAADALDREEPRDVVTPAELEALWITQKSARIGAYEAIATKLYENIMTTSTVDATELREFRFYLTAVANELGQLLHRGSGEQPDGDRLQVEFVGVDPTSFE